MGLDGVELVMAWEESFGIRIADPEAAAIRTPRAATELICRKVAAIDVSSVCLFQRAFYRSRRALQRELTCPRSRLSPQARIADLVPSHRPQVWRALAAESGVKSLTKHLFGWFGKTTLADLACSTVARHHGRLRDSTQFWTRAHVREVVRAIITVQLGISCFSDDADFVHDLRVDRR